jgi:hypothetical protein
VTTPELAVRVSVAFGTSSESWLNEQTYDPWHAERGAKNFGSQSSRRLRACPMVVKMGAHEGTENKAVVEEKGSFELKDQTVMVVPKKLVTQLIKRRRPRAGRV